MLLGLLHRVLYLRLLQPLYTGGKRMYVRLKILMAFWCIPFVHRKPNRSTRHSYHPSHSVRRRGRGPIALFFSLMLGSCILPFLLALLPLLLLWPITLFVLSVRNQSLRLRTARTRFQVSNSPPPPQTQTTTVLLLALTPLGALGLWLLFAAKPVQEKLMRPLLLASLRLTYPRRVLTLPRAPGW